jgi:hypothetical protein
VKNPITDRSLFASFVLLAPFILFMNVVSFDTKNSIGGIGTNLFVAILAALFLMAIARRKKRDVGLGLLVLIIGFIIVKNLSRQAGGAGIGEVIASLRVYVFFGMHYFLGCVYLNTEYDRARVLKAISVVTIVSAVVGILHYHFFYHIPFIDLKYATDKFGTVLYLMDASIMRFRETSLYFGPNVFAYMLVFGYVCFYENWLSTKDPTAGGVSLKLVAGTTLITYALVLTDSRSALFSLFILIFLNVIKGSGGALVRVIVPLVILCVVAALLTYSTRFSLSLALSDPRFVKIYIAYTLLSQSLTNWIIGLPLGAAWGDGDMAFSDNLYAALLLDGGFSLIFMLGIFVRIALGRIRMATAGASLSDRRYLTATKYALTLFLLFGLFAIPTGMTSLFNYLGLLLGGMTRISKLQKETPSLP